MANKVFQIPIKGLSEGFEVSTSEPMTSGYMNNVRPIDSLERRLRLGQRPGLEKKYAQQIGGIAAPIVAIISVSVVN